MSFASSHVALVVFDSFKGQCTLKVLSLLENHHIHIVIVSNCTDRLQPFNISVNKAVKECLRKKFQDWYSTWVCNHMDSPVTQQVDLSMSIVEPLGAVWLRRMQEFYELVLILTHLFHYSHD